MKKREELVLVAADAADDVEVEVVAGWKSTWAWAYAA